MSKENKLESNILGFIGLCFLSETVFFLIMPIIKIDNGKSIKIAFLENAEIPRMLLFLIGLINIVVFYFLLKYGSKEKSKY